MGLVPGDMTIVGLTWASATPILRVRRNTLPPADELLIGFQASFHRDRLARRWCLGSSGPGSSDEPCRELPERDRPTCTSCSVKNALFAGALHHAHQRETSDPEMVRHLDQPNRLYLAAFRDGSIKVGTSTATRSITRLLEQGAWQARFVADARDGVTIRVIEDLVTKQCSIPQSVSMSRKVSGHAQPITDDQMTRQLEECVGLVHGLIEADREAATRAGISLTNEMWRNPTASDALWDDVHEYPLDLRDGQHHLRVVGVCGSAIAFVRLSENEAGEVEVGRDTFVVNIKPLFGHGLSAKSGAAQEVAVQDRLF